MKTILRTFCAGIVLLVALPAQAQTLTYSNSITLSGGNPANVMTFDLPQFNPANGTLDSVTLTMYSSFQYLFTYDGGSGTGQLTFMQTNSLSFLYNGSDVLAQQNTKGITFNATLPSTGQSSTQPLPPALRGKSIFSDGPDLENFTGTGDIPLSAEYFNQPTVSWTGGTVAWNLTDTATMAAVVTYDFETVPEPGAIGITCLGGLIFALSGNRFWQKGFVSPKRVN
jgi:hypothetical protein